MIEHHHSKIQKRREKRLLELRNLSSIPYTKQFSSENIEERYQARFFINILVSIIVFIAIYLIFQASHPYANVAQKYIREVLTRDFNFDGLYSWYQEKFEGNPAILPTFAIKEKENANSISFKSPISSIPLSLEQTKLGINLKTNSFEPVMAVEKGIITYVGEQENLGKTIIIQHQSGFESTYAMLKNIDVKKDEWVEPGKILGTVENRLYFAIKNHENYLNPLEVIPFD